MGVYPRVCGGTAVRNAPEVHAKGLSPRVRGNLTNTAQPPRPRGSIPACAGEPAPCCGGSSACRVYPRVCGGTWPYDAGQLASTGLSPRVRGNPDRLASHLRVAGSIPACAGEPPLIVDLHDDGGVYPRVCGGTPDQVPTSTSAQGLSPRVRGNRFPFVRWQCVGGSIPACAGEPLPASRFRRRPRVYPRVCGGTPARSSRRRTTSGLSPRVRGNRQRVRGLLEHAGSIPACAGEPCWRGS